MKPNQPPVPPVTPGPNLRDAFEMRPEALREGLAQVSEWLADYHERVRELPVLSAVKPGDVRSQLPDQPPQQAEGLAAMLKDLNEIIEPGLTHWQSPNFYAYFPANISIPSLLGELLSSGLGVQGMIWATSPACTELETHVLDWLVDMLGLPQHFRSSTAGGGVIQDTASSAVLCALLAARERCLDGRGNEDGLRGGLTVYASSEAHSSTEKAVRIAGIGSANLRLIDCDENLAMRPEALAEAIDADLAAGLTPCFVCATVGTTSTHAMDPLEPIGEICQQRGVWFHVDGAMAGVAALCPEFRHLQAGVEYADSYCFNPHKWMFTNFDCSCFWVADRQALINSLSLLPEYLRNPATESGEVFDYRDWHVQLGRRFRALKLWMVIRWFGVAGLQAEIRRHVQMAQTLREWIEADPDFEILAPVPLTLICFRHRAGDGLTEQLLQQLNESGRLYLTHSKVHGRYVIRFSVGQAKTQLDDLRQAWESIQRSAAQLSQA